MGRPKKHLVRLVAHVRQPIKASIVEEAHERNMTIGELVEEAFCSRMVRIVKKEPKREASEQ